MKMDFNQSLIILTYIIIHFLLTSYRCAESFIKKMYISPHNFNYIPPIYLLYIFS